MIRNVIRYLGLACLVATHSGAAANETPFLEQATNLDRLIDSKNRRIQALEQEVLRLRQSCDDRRDKVPASPAEAKPPRRSDSATVCYRGCKFRDLGKAVKAAQAGDTITVAPEINGSCAVIRKPLRLVGLKDAAGNRAHLAGGVCMGKGPLVVKSHDVTIEGFEISEVSVGGKNGACIRLDPEARDVVVRDIYCHDSQQGMLGTIKGQLLIEDSRFENNGFNRGQSHGLYLLGDSAVVRRTAVVSTRHSGHSLKIGVQDFLLEDSIIAALSSRNSRALDNFTGGTVVMRRNIIQQGPNSENSEVLGIALEPKRLKPAGHSLTLEDNWIIYDDPERNNTQLISGKKFGPWKMRGNRIVGIRKPAERIDESINDIWYDDRMAAGLPAWDGTLATLPKPGE